MIYLISAATALMFGYMLWSTLFRLRHDRVKTQRRLTRGKFAFRPKERLRFLLGRSFQVADDKAEWEEPLVSSLDQATREAAAGDQPVARESRAVP